MKKLVLLLGVAVAASANSDAAFMDGTFEATQIAANSYAYNPTSAFYNFLSKSGLASGDSGLSNPTTSGQVAFLQSSGAAGGPVGAGSIFQEFTVAAGTYTLSFSAANRAGGAQSAFAVLIDGQTIAVVAPTRATFATTSLTVALTGTVHVLNFVAAGSPTQDSTSFLDNIAFTSTATPPAVPEPASALMLGVGLTGAGVAGRHRFRRS